MTYCSAWHSNSGKHSDSALLMMSGLFCIVGGHDSEGYDARTALKHVTQLQLQQLSQCHGTARTPYTCICGAARYPYRLHSSQVIVLQQHVTAVSCLNGDVHGSICGVPASWHGLAPNPDTAIHEGACSDHCGPASEGQPKECPHSLHLVIRAQVQPYRHAFSQEQVGRFLKDAPHFLGVLYLVGLGSECMHCRPLQNGACIT